MAKPIQVKLKLAKVYEVTFPNGRTMTMKQDGDEWKGMIELVGTSHTHRAIVSPEGGSLSRAWHEAMREQVGYIVVQISPSLIETAGLMDFLAEPPSTND
jgi:hypothetical protein